MSNHYLEENVDIFVYPEVRTFDPPSQITIGDLHANSMKLLFLLRREGIAENLNKQTYDKLALLYQKGGKGLSPHDLTEFDKAIDDLKLNKHCLIRFIGDVFSDRGENDYFTLKLFYRMHEESIAVENIVSNHDMEFIEAYETQSDFSLHRLLYQHARSMEHLNHLLCLDFKSRTQILCMIDKAYKTTLRAISYTLYEDSNEITIYSHAGIGIETIKAMAKKCKVNYQDITSDALANTLDEINLKYQNYVSQNQVHTLYNPTILSQGYNDLEFDGKSYPLEFALWSRNYDKITRPQQINDYHLQWVHGHDSQETTHLNIFNLNNLLGCNYGQGFKNSGLYTILIANQVRYTMLDKVLLN